MFENGNKTTTKKTCWWFALSSSFFICLLLFFAWCKLVVLRWNFLFVCLLSFSWCLDDKRKFFFLLWRVFHLFIFFLGSIAMFSTYKQTYISLIISRSIDQSNDDDDDDEKKLYKGQLLFGLLLLLFVSKYLH